MTNQSVTQSIAGAKAPEPFILYCCVAQGIVKMMWVGDAQSRQKQKLAPRVCPGVGPRSGGPQYLPYRFFKGNAPRTNFLSALCGLPTRMRPRERPPTRAPTRVPTRVDFLCFALQGLPGKAPTKHPTKVPTRKCPRKCALDHGGFQGVARRDNFTSILRSSIHAAKCWSRRYAERIWGDFFILARRISGKLPANFSANFDREFFGLVFPGLQATQKNSRPKFTSRIVGIPLQSHFLEPKIFCLRGRPKNWAFSTLRLAAWRRNPITQVGESERPGNQGDRERERESRQSQRNVLLRERERNEKKKDK